MGEELDYGDVVRVNTQLVSVPAVVTDTDAASIKLRAGDLKLTIDRKGFAWTRKTAPSQLVSRGDLVEAKLLTIDTEAHTATAVILDTRREMYIGDSVEML